MPSTSVWQQTGVERGPQTELWRGWSAMAVVRVRREVRVKMVECIVVVGERVFLLLVVMVVVVVRCIGCING